MPSFRFLFGIAPGGACHAGLVTKTPVGSYPTLSPLPRLLSRRRFGEKGRRGGLLSVALSLGSPPPDVIRHRVSMEPGLSSPAAFRHLAGRGRPAGWWTACSPLDAAMQRTGRRWRVTAR